MRNGFRVSGATLVTTAFLASAATNAGAARAPIPNAPARVNATVASALSAANLRAIAQNLQAISVHLYDGTSASSPFPDAQQIAKDMRAHPFRFTFTPRISGSVRIRIQFVRVMGPSGAPYHTIATKRFTTVTSGRPVTFAVTPRSITGNDLLTLGAASNGKFHATVREVIQVRPSGSRRSFRYALHQRLALET